MSKELFSATKLAAEKHNDVVVSYELPTVQDGSVGSDIFMGIGLLSKEELTCGLGIHVLLMLCFAKLITDRVPGTQTHILVADLHASENGANVALSQISDIADEVVLSTTKTMTQLGCPAKVFRASHHQLFNFPENGGYLSRQTKDLLQLEKLGVKLKVGWQSRRTGVRDEKYFDDKAGLMQPNGFPLLAFARVLEGISSRTWKSEHQTIPPYFGEPGAVLGKPINLKGLITDRQMSNRFGIIGRFLGKSLKIQRPSIDLLQEFVDGLR